MSSILKVDTLQDSGGNTLLTSNGSGTLTTNNIGGQNTPAFHAYLSAVGTTLTSNSFTKVAFNSELYDTDNFYDNSTNYRFTPTTAGKYMVYSGLTVTGD